MAIANQKIKTEDVISILDTKILSTSAHSLLNVLVGESYDAILTKLASQVLSPAEKEAFDNTLSVPSATNPIVLKNDLQSYIPQADLGEVKDSVQTFADLPPTGNTTGDLRAVIDDNIIYRWNGSAWIAFIHTGTLDHTQLTNFNGNPSYQHLSTAEKSNLLSQTHIHSNLSILQQITSSGSGQIITTAERNNLPTASQKAALVGTSGQPSATNLYVTSLDSRLNTVRNPYITIGPPGSLATYSGVDSVPFQNAFLAIDTGSASAVKAIEVLPGSYNLGGTVLTWNNTAPLLLEAFAPGSVILSFQTFQASIEALGASGSPLVIRGFVFELNNFNTSGIRSLRPNTIIEDCVFKPGPTTSTNQIGLTLEGSGTVIRRCRFEGLLTKGIEVKAPNCIIEECTFDITVTQALSVHIYAAATNCTVDHNTFKRGRIKTESTYAHIFNNYWEQSSTGKTCTISNTAPMVVSCVHNFQNSDLVTFTSSGTLPAPLVIGKRYFVKNRTPTNFELSLTAGGSTINGSSAGTGTHTVLAADLITESGSGSRYINNQPAEFNQPYIGTYRTVGPINSYADYRTSDETGFLTALDDARVRNTNLFLEVLPGTYTFTKTVDVFKGCRIRGGVLRPSALTETLTQITTNGVAAFNMEQNSSIEGLYFNHTDTPCITISTSNVEIKDCEFSSNATNTGIVTYASLYLNNASNFSIRHNRFNGTRGIYGNTDLRGQIFENIFLNSLATIQTVNGSQDQIKDNYFIDTAASPDIGGSQLIIEGNHFLGTLPTKLGTTDSIWQSNYPNTANNISGIGSIILEATGYCQPLSGVVYLNDLSGVGAFAFDPNYTSSIATTPLEIGGRINKLLGFQVELSWSSFLDTGAVKWEATVVFRDAAASTFGTSVSLQNTSIRTGSTEKDEDKVTFNFTNLQYGGVTDPTHISLIVSRLGGNPGDTLSDSSYLTNIKVTLPRD
jgi:hypothetical protein